MKKVILGLLLAFLSAFLYAANKFTPGEVWKDKRGVQINAHGACVVFHDGMYYWFGEDRSGFVSNGVSCYKSSDLYNWERVGLALTHTGTVTEDMNDIAPGRLMERPKVIYNERTRKWVMWFHWEKSNSDYGAARVGVAYSDKVEGPYKFYKAFNPNGHSSRDQTVIVDTDGKAYHFANIGHMDINIALLRDDYLEPTATENVVFKGTKFEAPAIFKVGETYYGLFSLSDGWNPTPGQTGYSTDIMGDWFRGTNFAVDPKREKTYQSQSAFVLKVEGLDKAYIYMGDRWNSGNVGISNYVWLPISMRSGYPTVRWYDSWDLSVFEDMYRYKRAGEIVSGNTYSLLERSSNRFVSQKATGGFSIQNDSENITGFVFVETETPYVYKIKDASSGMFLENILGSVQWREESESPSQNWYLDLQEDGYYRIQNLGGYELKYWAVSGNSTFHDSNIYLTGSKDEAVFLALYFDSEQYDYKEADPFSKAYREENRKKIEERDEQWGSVTQPSFLADFSVYPAVNDGNFRVAFGENDFVSGDIRIIEAGTGRLVFSAPVCGEDREKAIRLAGRLADGMYFVCMVGDTEIVTKKIIVK